MNILGSFSDILKVLNIGLFLINFHCFNLRMVFQFIG